MKRPPAAAAPAGHASASVEVVQLQELLTTSGAVDPVELPEDQALAETRLLLTARAQLEAVLLRRLGDVDARKLHRLDDSPTTTAWVRAHDARVAASTVTLARRLVRLPGLEDAVRSGALSADTAARIAAALTTLRPLVDRPDGLIDGQDGEQAVTAVVLDGVSDAVFQALGSLAQDDPHVDQLVAALSEVSCSPTSQLARLEAAFVLLARHLPAGCLPAALGQLVDALLPNLLEKRAARGADQAQLTLRPNADGSGWLLRGQLDLETGELAHTVLTAMAATDPDNPADTSASEQLRAAARGPGCRLVPHHRDAWAHSGTTALGDTGLLCDPDHGALHRGQTITLKDGRRLNQNGWVV